ncbi:glycoside hydrolase family 65 [Sediminibacillus massiliensis]|uniref:glycoside hydrolase family 65 n=1 Tax=Sediminibacillus massiliensis TaxID=1926277 RepID=UPI00098862A6|nr:glycoside hydrolase family 65 [Sediminibacillus massiliensis]
MIDRKKVVSRHHPALTKADPLSPLSVGNGEFSFTADITGLQTFAKDYDVPLGTQSQWGWHYSGHSGKYEQNDLELQSFSVQGRQVQYPLYPQGKEDAYHWLRQNPHRLQLGQISFRLFKENGGEAGLADLEQVYQTLNLWEGILHSEFILEGSRVSVQTVCHPERNQIAVSVTSDLMKADQLQVLLRFPSGDMNSRKWEEAIFPDWSNEDGHSSILKKESEHRALITRRLDEDWYEVSWHTTSGRIEQAGMHEFILFPDHKKETLRFSIGFSHNEVIIDSFEVTSRKSRQYWSDFWKSGGVIDFSESTDQRAHELERRVVLSQYLTAVHGSGSLPPQETGLMYNSWFGKFHLEMHWWHAAHFFLWGREHLIEDSMEWYINHLSIAKELAGSQGYQGARWPKMTGPDGKQTPSEIAPVLIWQQPHPLSFAELSYQSQPTTETLKKWRDVVRETADFMVSYAEWDEGKQAYVLGPPLIPAQECHSPDNVRNPAFELEYWNFGLNVAVEWMERLNEPANPKWREVLDSMTLPAHADGIYLAHENCPDTFEKYNHDHPSMVAAMGMLPGHLVDSGIMKTTLERVWAEWQWESAWGWDFPMCAMTAARIGETKLAVDFLLMDVTKNRYLANGHNYQNPSLTAYLPGNGGLLAAVSMMACGWRDADERENPGFPEDGPWKIKWEGLRTFL